MMRYVVACIAMGIAAQVSAASIKSYYTHLDVAPDGSAQAAVTVQLSSAEAGMLTLPVAVTPLDGFVSNELPPGVSLRPMTAKDQHSVVVTLPASVASDAKLGFTFNVPQLLVEPKPETGQKSTLPAGTRLLRHAFINTQNTPISMYRVEVRLPTHTQVHVVREQLPKAGRKEFVPRVELVGLRGNQGAVLQLANIKQGDRTSMELEVVDTQRTYLWLLVGLILGIGYLVAFRDLLKPAAHDTPNVAAATVPGVTTSRAGESN
jgi:hypothetical protein